MINCSSCQKPMLKANLIITSTRDVNYINVLFVKRNRKKKFRHGKLILPPKKIIHYTPTREEIEKLKFEGWNLVKTWKTQGKEIVKVINLCKECEKDLK